MLATKGSKIVRANLAFRKAQYEAIKDIKFTPVRLLPKHCT
jgi:hypothetical protein